MAIKIRLAMHGLRNNRFFHLVAIDHRKARNAKPTELLGIYKPGIEGTEGKKTLEWSANRIKYWLNVGAVPSKPVVGLLERGGILRPGSPFHRQAAPPLIAPATPQPVKPAQAKAQGRVAPKAKVAPRTAVASKAKGASKAPNATQARARST
ncbi:putative 37S ribosomal protein S16, mitochondrial [Leucoagaricus sp. SymC.cos]|nr:putative 37S ribosomal protein S16, mitochondrial [Leucoagaricus sp. SymC.cos]